MLRQKKLVALKIPFKAFFIFKPQLAFLVVLALSMLPPLLSQPSDGISNSGEI